MHLQIIIASNDFKTVVTNVNFFYFSNRGITTHTTPVTDTDDTDDDDNAGPMKFYSHSVKSLTHQHWVSQVISAGGFNVHNVQAAEASHKLNMYLSSRRVRHRGANQTQDSMLDFGCNHTVFEELKHVLPEAFPVTTRKKRERKPGMSLPLNFDHNFSGPGPVGDKFLHPDLRLQEIEVANLVCQKLRLDQTVDSYMLLRPLKFFFGQHFVRSDGRAFWATNERRDILRLKGIVNGNALCGEAVCFLAISNVKSINRDYVEDTQTYALIRWFEPHPDSWERDALKRPVCPGPMHVNNCLWVYSKTPTLRRSMVGRDRRRRSISFVRHKHYFGSNEEEQHDCRLLEQDAYYTLVKTDSIEDTVNMCPIFKRNSSTFEKRTWLETVRLR